jgi:hypothetical protein
VTCTAHGDEREAPILLRRCHERVQNIYQYSFAIEYVGCTNILIKFFTYLVVKRLCSSVGMEIGKGMDCQVSIAARGQRFVSPLQRPDGLCVQPILLFNDYWGPFSRV